MTYRGQIQKICCPIFASEASNPFPNLILLHLDSCWSTAVGESHGPQSTFEDLIYIPLYMHMILEINWCQFYYMLSFMKGGCPISCQYIVDITRNDYKIGYNSRWPFSTVIHLYSSIPSNTNPIDRMYSSHPLKVLPLLTLHNSLMGSGPIKWTLVRGEA